LFFCTVVKDLSLYSRGGFALLEASVVLGFTPPFVVNTTLSCPRHALVADDCVSSRLLTRAVLHSFDFIVDCASHGQEALEAVHARPYDVVILDGQMPFLTGPEVAAQIEAEWTHPWARPCVIALSADDSMEDHERWRSSGVEECLCKPLTVTGLKQCLHRLANGETQLPSDEASAWVAGCVDWSGLDQLHGHICPQGNEEPFNRIFSKFAQEVIGLLEDMTDSAPQSEYDRRTLHKLKGLLGFMYMVGPIKLVTQAGEAGVLQMPARRRQWVSDTLRAVEACIGEIVTRYSIRPT
jgi:CheY-like chemotaxis protein